jgi:hypothetical protein
MSAADQERACNRAVARFLLTTASAWGIKVGTDGVNVSTVATTRGVPAATIFALERELVKHRRPVIEEIYHENAARTGGLVPDAFDAEGVS